MMISKIVRRTHMYLALFLFPWVLMYALSTLVMNHRALFVGAYGDGPIPFVEERRLVYDGVFPENAELRTISKQILMSVGLDGAHGVSRRKDGTIAINRNDLVSPRRLTYSPADRTLVDRTAAASAQCVSGTVPSAARLRHGLRPRHGLGSLGRPLHRRDGLLGAVRALDVVGDEGDAGVRTDVARRPAAGVFALYLLTL